MKESSLAKRWAAIVAVQGFALTVLAASSGAQVVLYGAAHAGCGNGGEPGAGASTLYTIDPATGVATLVGPILDADEEPFEGVTGMAFLRDGRLVASARDDEPAPRGIIVDDDRSAILIEIDPASGAATLIGEIGNNTDDCGRMPDLSYDPTTSTLYGLGDSCDGGSENDSLFAIDPDTGDGTRIGLTGTEGGGNGLARQPFTGTLFHTPSDTTNLYTVNPATGESTPVEDTADDRSSINALDFHPLTGALYGSEKNGLLVTIDTTSGSTTSVDLFRNGDGEAIECFDALAFDAPAGCTNAPVGPCLEGKAGGSKLRFTAKDGKESWKWKGGQIVKADFGDPLTQTDYRICTYDTIGGFPVLVAGQRVPAGTGWQDKSTGFKYKSLSGDPDGIAKVRLKEGTDKAKITAKGNVAVPSLPLAVDDRVVTQLLNSDGECWGSTFVGPAKKNDEKRFKAKN